MNLILTKDALYRLSYVGFIAVVFSKFLHHPAASLECGAGDEVRTRDLQLGRLELFQLSYSRSIPQHSHMDRLPGET